MFLFMPRQKTNPIQWRVILYLINNGNSTITEVSHEIGLSIPTTTKLINSLCEIGYVQEYGKLDSSEGRHPILYGVNPDSAYFVGVDMINNSLTIGITDFRGSLVDMRSDIPYQYDNTPASLEKLCSIVDKTLGGSVIERGKIRGLNVNISGRVNSKTGYSYSMFNFSEEPLAAVLSERLGLDVGIDNDSRAMAYGEYVQGGGKERDVFFVNLSWGLGSGIIIDGRLYGGCSGFAGEFGHMHFFDNEQLCHCGKKGCLETEVSGRALRRNIIARIEKGESSALSKVYREKGDIGLMDIIHAIKGDDMLCIDALEALGSKLGEALAGVINIFNPELIVIGGMLSLTEDNLLQPVKMGIRKYALSMVQKDTKIRLSKLKDKAGIIGSCLLARRRFLE